MTPRTNLDINTLFRDEHTLKVGVNYRFNFSSPVVARY